MENGTRWRIAQLFALPGPSVAKATTSKTHILMKHRSEEEEPQGRNQLCHFSHRKKIAEKLLATKRQIKTRIHSRKSVHRRRARRITQNRSVFASKRFMLALIC